LEQAVHAWVQMTSFISTQLRAKDKEFQESTCFDQEDIAAYIETIRVEQREIGEAIEFIFNTCSYP
jgi:hypothetical protein